MASGEGPRSVLLIGTADAGKTNFLARLWITLDSSAGLLKKAALPAHLDYLRIAAEHLLEGEFAPHTSQEVHDKTEIPVRTTIAGHEFHGTLVVPDVPGEQILSVYRNRRWSNEWEDLIGPGCGCLLFVRVDSKELVAPLDWITCIAHLGSPPKSVPLAQSPQEKQQAPTQVILVEWLQFLRKAFTERIGGKHRPRIGIVVAAWDRVPQEQQAAGPAAWVASNLPLLHQFVETNDEDFGFAYFGVTVASGDLAVDKEFKASYLSGDPRKAGAVVYSLAGQVESAKDMTLPVAWALGFVGAFPDPDSARR